MLSIHSRSFVLSFKKIPGEQKSQRLPVGLPRQPFKFSLSILEALFLATTIACCLHKYLETLRYMKYIAFLFFYWKLCRIVSLNTPPPLEGKSQAMGGTRIHIFCKHDKCSTIISKQPFKFTVFQKLCSY